MIYLVLSGLVTKFIFEFVLGQWYFEQSQNQQWLFYSFLLLDYAVSFRKIINLRVTINRNSAFAFLLLIMIAQGTLVGLSLGNQPFIMFNDMIPLLMIALNILRMQSSGEMSRPIDFNFLFKFTVTVTFLTCIIGYAATLLGKPASSAIVMGQVFYPPFLAALFTIKPFPKMLFSFALISMLLSLEDINRTTMVFLVLIFGIYLYKTIVTRPIKGGILIFLVASVVITAFFTMPKDSNTYKRITDIATIDLESRKGSVGERQAEQDAIQKKLDTLGPTYQMLGLGLGGLYEVTFTHRYITDYGHAHYAWAWFNLRFGITGYIYLAIMFSILILNAINNFQMRSQAGLLLTLLVFLGILYCFTYVNAVFILSGLHFYHYTHRKKGIQNVQQ